MPAIPAWPPASMPRLFVEQPLSADLPLRLEGAAANYLGNVMRLGPGNGVNLFDDLTGDWAARVEAVGKRAIELTVADHLRPREAVPDLWLVAAPIKKGRIDLVAEKACELGVDRLVPVITRRTVVEKPKLERLRAHMIEAAEQCGRNALPSLAEPVGLAVLLKDWPTDRALFFADETGGEPALEAMRAHRGPAAILIGPEGGFDPAEREAVRALASARGIGLGPRTLRAETAAIAAITLWMAAAGDW
ncbi:16S rRNA (uracil(1498)-N(3))-methyltransferase [Sphingomonas sp. ID0503]|uniref:16S rRNA (uracil(1498)-N(3))-methyltransferase n=1 Tax=Sphingomonas sp. ID0503 TaxID=3399691 RepID=UPI003AFAE80E